MNTRTVWSHILVFVGLGAMVVGAMVMMSMLGGIGGRSGRSVWWGLFILPYPVGWIMGLVGVILRLVESFRRSMR